MTLRTWDIWYSHAYPSIRRIFIFQEPPPPSFPNINFDGNIMDGRGGAGFVTHGPNSQLIVAGGVRLVKTSMLGVELRTAQKRICFARLTLQADLLIVEGDSAIVVARLLGRSDCDSVTHPLVRDIHYLLLQCAIYDIKHIYHEPNNTVDWFASFVTHHSGESF